MEDGGVITFYSFKGGTGRTMALANCGVELAGKAGGDVLMLDWDLEAPGLHDFFPEATASPKRGPVRGVVELFEQAAELTGGQSELSPAAARSFWEGVDFDEYIVPTADAGLHLLPAGRLDRGYGTRVNTLPWRDLFECGPDLFRAFAERLRERYRHVLIDSRTGVTDSSGICTMLLPDHLVVVFNANRQSLAGGLEQARRATDYRSRSDDARPLLVFPLVSRVEMSEDELRHRWRHGDRGTPGYQPAFERLFEQVYGLPDCDLEQYFDEIQIQHAARYAYGESIAVRDEPTDRLSLSRSYQRFTRALLAPGGPWLFEATPPNKATAAEIERALKEADSYRRSHLTQARLARRLDLATFVVAGATALGSVVQVVVYKGPTPSQEFLRIGLPLLLLSLALLLGRTFFGFGLRFQAHSQAASEIQRERTLFSANARPYASAFDPAALLIERCVEIDAQAEQTINGSNPSDHLTRRMKDDGD